MSSDDDDDNVDSGQLLNLYTCAGRNVNDFRKAFKFNLDSLEDSTADPDLEECKTDLPEPSVSPSKKVRDSSPDSANSPISKIEISDDEDTVPLQSRLEGRRTRSSHAITPAPAVKNGSRGRGRGRGRGRATPRGRRGRLSNVEKATINLLKEPSPEYKPFIESNWSLDDTLCDESLVIEDDDNYEISVKVHWKSDKIVKFPIRKYQKLSTLFEHFAKLENIPQNHILLTFRDNIITESDTPDSLGLTIASIIDGGVTTVTAAGGNTVARPASPVDLDSIELKVRTKDSKQPTMIRLKKTQKMMVMMTKFSEQMEISLEKLKFSFDGDALDPNDTPTDLDLEGGEMIDLVVLA